MAIDVVMPQMGESIAEGTVVRWMKKVGESVERDEPLLEISTDKVDAEIPSPASGTLSEILAQEGQTVAVNSVVARIAPSSRPSTAAPTCRCQTGRSPTARPVAAGPQARCSRRPAATRQPASQATRARARESKRAGNRAGGG
jgi:pyruvate dehydrogenase E2 component (dihydrolipoamide acetyltransferase)